MARRTFSAERLAGAIAKRMTSVVPAGFNVRAAGPKVGAVHAGAWMTQANLEEWVTVTADDADIERAAAACLEAVQDGITRITGEPWPRRTAEYSAPVADANSRLGPDLLELWFGDELAPDLRLEAIPVPELLNEDDVR